MKDLFRRGPKRFTPATRENGQHIPDNMWVKCPSCGDLTYVKQLQDNLKVCKCGYHMRLSAREWQVLDLLVEGCSTRAIAGRLSISAVTVRRHASAAMRKLGVPDREAAVELLRGQVS